MHVIRMTNAPKGHWVKDFFNSLQCVRDIWMHFRYVPNICLRVTSIFLGHIFNSNMIIGVCTMGCGIIIPCMRVIS